MVLSWAMFAYLSSSLNALLKSNVKDGAAI